jgi:hypothetical protein
MMEKLPPLAIIHAAMVSLQSSGLKLVGQIIASCSLSSGQLAA